MEDLQLVLFVLGAIAIVAVLVHGFWSIRKQQPRAIKEQPRTPYAMSPGRRDAEGFDADGIGEVRVRKLAPDDTKPEAAKTPHNDAFSLSDEPKVRRVKERHEPVMDTHRAAAPSHANHDNRAHVEPASPAARQVQLGLLDDLDQEPSPEDLYEDLNDFDDGYDAEYDPYDNQQSSVSRPEAAQAAVTQAQTTQAQTQAQAQVKTEEPLPDPRDVLVLHVVAREGLVLAGAELLPCLLELNFKYGDMEIFHRHEDNAGNGKVLFSLANMLKPGTFDPDTMEQFNTHGIVLFMTLPCHGEAVMNFSLMLNSACQLADDLDALVLDGQRQLWSDATKAQYLARIRASA
ncbi:cell division protein ZipA [Shewanella litorisediminis]|uniref:Cell division protein ZipA n=1 Tax=Shewanella litorisediminis TaxID=1173586 RepID=A0ABX7G784_9GAMM|nr:cell division protein ZipA [Shewanella litorisediminis]MCL2919805.1 cell division protein ZipA [Shewanella litorisediminis]QRH03224.1 cell division protein ZipA [Shewanella litorisediminis]